MSIKADAHRWHFILLSITNESVYLYNINNVKPRLEKKGGLMSAF